MRREFERVPPTEVGIPIDTVHWLLDQLESGYTEPHGLMVMRHGKIAVEGYWAPYAAGIRHGLQSHSKAYTATAVGIAVREGVLRLNERIAEIFPDRLPEHPSEKLMRLTVHDVLCMGCGMEKEPDLSGDWIRNFLAEPVIHEPGTVFMYNTTGTSILNAAIREKTGLGLQEYLTPRLFEKIGIDASNIRWFCMSDGADGTEAGGGGMFATLEDNLRLMKLYANGGVWDGERILTEEFVKKATSKQIDNSPGSDPIMTDNRAGYGYQLWMCRPEGAYRADGAMGQFTVVIPKSDMILSILETAADGPAVQHTLDVFWEFVKRVETEGKDAADRMRKPQESGNLKSNDAETQRLHRRLCSLALPAPEYRDRRIGDIMAVAGGYRITEGKFQLSYYGNVMPLLGMPQAAPVTELAFEFAGEICRIRFREQDDEREKTILIGLDGSRRDNELEGQLPSRVLASGYWEDASTLAIALRWVETCDEFCYRFTFRKDGLGICWNREELFAPVQYHATAVRRQGNFEFSS